MMQQAEQLCILELRYFTTLTRKDSPSDKGAGECGMSFGTKVAPNKRDGTEKVLDVLHLSFGHARESCVENGFLIEIL